MKKSLLFTTILLLGLAACCKDEPVNNFPTTDVGVVIDGVKWATRNVAMPGTFTNNPEDAGMFFQWNSNTAWLPIGDDPVSLPAGGTWQTTEQLAGDSWNNGRGPCPPGWRLPTREELESLNNTESAWVRENEVNGRLFGTAPYQVFFPARGFRLDTDGIFHGLYFVGYYWSASVDNPRGAFGLFFRYRESRMIHFNRANGFPVRCVAEN